LIEVEVEVEVELRKGRLSRLTMTFLGKGFYMCESWDDCANDWDTNIDAITYAKNAYETLIQKVSIEGKVILDFGCGTGLLTERLATLAKRIVAIDTSPNMINILEAKHLCNVVPLTEKLTLKLVKQNPEFVNKFDIVVVSSVFSFLPDYASILNILKTLLCPGGFLVQWDWLSSDDNAEFGLSESKIKKTLTAAGFHNIVLTKPFALDGKNGSMPVIMGVAINT